ncbi:hypothetical protein Taro_040259 [Colocasia esculenta]|uniref:Uncharacterized protein n=1 Tax=Colocasia esculenta TaxID=4460 RepID=A0A843WXZ0_COLES|nr:hypothetical protein [Colocasia esculenta]
MVCTGLGRSLGGLYWDAPRLRRSACGSRWCYNACAGCDSFSCRGGHGCRDGLWRRDNFRDSRSPGARHLNACPVREVVTVAWDPRPHAPVEGVLRVAGVLELRTLEWRGKRWLGQQRSVVCRALVVGLGCRGHLESFPAQASVRLLSSGRARIGRRRRGGSRRPRS